MRKLRHPELRVEMFKMVQGKSWGSRLLILSKLMSGLHNLQGCPRNPPKYAQLSLAWTLVDA